MAEIFRYGQTWPKVIRFLVVIRISVWIQDRIEGFFTIAK